MSRVAGMEQHAVHVHQQVSAVERIDDRYARCERGRLERVTGAGRGIGQCHRGDERQGDQGRSDNADQTCH